MAEGGVIPPLMAEDDPFEEPTEQPVQAATMDDVWAGFFSDKGNGDIVFVPQVPSSAFDPNPPTIDGRELGAAQLAHEAVKRELERAAKPLLKSLGPSFEQLARFGYNKPNVDPAAEQLQPMIRKLVRNF